MIAKKQAEYLSNPSLEFEVLQGSNLRNEQGNQQQLDLDTSKEIRCPKCDSEVLYKRGFTRHGGQQYNCKKCSHWFCPDARWKMLEKDKTIACPHCNSNDCFRRGKEENGTQNYSCKVCEKYFRIHPKVDKEGREIRCPDCSSDNFKLNGTVNGKTSYKCKDCNRKYVLNPYGRNDINYLNNINCRWCGSNAFIRKGLNKAGKQQCKCQNCKRMFTFMADRPGTLFAPEKFDFNYDVWTANHLGYKNGVHYHDKINFEDIAQSWLKEYFKKYVVYLSSTRLAFGTLIGKVSYINVFSKFLLERSYNQEFSGINRALVIDYLVLPILLCKICNKFYFNDR